MTHQEITAAEEMMKLAINNQSHVDSLIGYYRDIIDDFNNQRAEWIIHYNNLKVNAEDQYLLDQEILKYKDNLGELQKQLATKKANLVYERQKYFKFIENNEALKKKLQKTKQNYRQMMNACKPVGANKKFTNSMLGNRQDSKLNQFKDSGTSNTTALQLELININKDHQQHKNRIKDEIDELKDQLSGLFQEFGNRQQQCKSQYREALQKLCDLQQKNMELTSKFFSFRCSNMQDQKKIQQQSEIYRLKNLAILQKLKSLQKYHSQQFKNIDNQVKKQNNSFKKHYDEQLKQKQQHLSLLKEQYERIQDIYLNKIKKMQTQLKQTNQKLKICEDKGKVQISSLKSQIKILRNRLQNNIGVHHMRDQMASKENSDDMNSSASLQMSQLDRINQQVSNLAKQIDKK